MSTCPICQKQTSPAYKPFCSKRCADIDLNRWFSGAYAVPAAPDEDNITDEASLEDENLSTLSN